MTVPRTGILDIPADKEHNRWILGHGFEMFGLRDPDRPFFLVISLEGPHPPLVVPEPWYHLYDPEAIPEPENWNPGPGEPGFLEGSYYRRLRNEWGEDFSAWRKSIAVYWGYATYIDALFGQFVQRLEECDLLDDTLAGDALRPRGDDGTARALAEILSLRGGDPGSLGHAVAGGLQARQAVVGWTPATWTWLPRCWPWPEWRSSPWAWKERTWFPI